MNKEDVIILNQYPNWIYFLHPDSDKHIDKIIGKWVHHNTPEKLENLAQEFVQLIIEGLCSQFKFRPTLNGSTSPYYRILPPMCIYSDTENKDRVHTRLKQYNLSNLYWQSNEETEREAKNINQLDLSKFPISTRLNT